MIRGEVGNLWLKFDHTPKKKKK